MNYESLTAVKSEQFWRNVLQQEGKLNEVTGCIETDRPYKFVRVNYVFYMLHRVALCILKRIDLTNLNSLHRCDNPKCINEEHLFPGTQQTNLIDCRTKGRNQYSKMQRKLSDTDVRSIRKHLKEGTMTQNDIKLKFKTNNGTIYRLIQGTIYKDVV